MKLYKINEVYKIQPDDKFFLRSLGVIIGVKHPCQWYLPEWNLILESKDCGDVARIFFQVRKYAEILRKFEELKPLFKVLDEDERRKELPSIFLDNFKFDSLVPPTDVPFYRDGLLYLSQYVIPIKNWKLSATEEEWLELVDYVLSDILKEMDRIQTELYAKYTI